MGSGCSSHPEANITGKVISCGLHGASKTFPYGVCGEWMPKGATPGRQFLQGHSDAVKAMLPDVGLVVEYAQLKNAIVERCGGKEITGWDSDAIVQLIHDEYHEIFKAKGVEIFYCMKLQIEGRYHEHFHWLELKNIGKADPYYVPREVYRGAEAIPTEMGLGRRLRGGTRDPRPVENVPDPVTLEKLAAGYDVTQPAGRPRTPQRLRTPDLPGYAGGHVRPKTPTYPQ